MQKNFKENIQKQDLFNKSHRILLAISGGIDSIVMLDLFIKTQGYNFAIAHCNFGLRGKESNRDEEFVKNLGSQYKVPVYTQLFDTQNYASNHKISIQMAARDLRYTWFSQILNSENYDLIATAHHKNDVLETVLLNLTRGTGIAGLHGILPKNNHIVRPLLFAKKEEIEQYAQKNNLTWREDTSNLDDKYERNLIRLEVIPLLKQLNTNLENTFEQTIEKLRETEAVFLDKVQVVAQKICRKVEDNYFINLEKLKEEKNPIMILFQILQSFGFSYIQVKEIWQKRVEHSGKIFESPTHSLAKDRKQLVITHQTSAKSITHLIFQNQKEFITPYLKLHFEKIKVDIHFKIEPHSDIAFLDLDKLEFPLEFRVWQQGEKFYPLGMKNQRKISDFLIDVKVPVNLKNQVFVLVSNNKIAWLVRHRIDERFKITPYTKNILKIVYQLD